MALLFLLFLCLLLFLLVHLLQFLEQGLLLLLAHVLEHLRPVHRGPGSSLGPLHLDHLLHDAAGVAAAALVHVPGGPAHGETLGPHLLDQPVLVDVLDGRLRVHRLAVQRAPLVRVHVPELAALDALRLANLQ